MLQRQSLQHDDQSYTSDLGPCFRTEPGMPGGIQQDNAAAPLQIREQVEEHPRHGVTKYGFKTDQPMPRACEASRGSEGFGLPLPQDNACMPQRLQTSARCSALSTRVATSGDVDTGAIKRNETYQAYKRHDSGMMWSPRWSSGRRVYAMGDCFYSSAQGERACCCTHPLHHTHAAWLLVWNRRLFV